MMLSLEKMLRFEYEKKNILDASTRTYVRIHHEASIELSNSCINVYEYAFNRK